MILKTFQRVSASLLVLAATMNFANAATYYWDSDDTTPGFGATSGTWGTDAFWSTIILGTGTTANTPITGVDDVNFGTAANGYTGTVTVNGTQNVRLLTFGAASGLVTLTGGTISLNTGGGITVAAGLANNATISSNLTISGAQTFNIGAGRTLTLDTGTFTRNAGATLDISGTVNSTMTGFSANDATGIIGNWAFFGNSYAKFTGSTITALGYTGGADGTSVAASASVNSLTGLVNYKLTAGLATLGANANINTLQTSAGGTLANSGTFTTNGILNTSGAGLTFSGPVTIGSSNALVVNDNGGGIVFNGAIGGAAGASFTKIGSQTVTFNVANTFTGATNINSGILLYGGNVAYGTVAGNVAIAPGATLRTAGGSSMSVTFTGTVLNNGAITRDSTGNTIFSNAISGTGSVTLVTGAGGLTLNGNNTFAGGLNVSGAGGGTNQLNIGNNGALGTGTFTWGTGPAFNINVTNWSNSNNNATVWNTGAITFAGTFTTADFGNGAMTLNQNTAFTNTNAVTFGGAIGENAGGRTFGKAGGGALTLSGSSSNTYTGLTSVTGGTLNLNKSGTANAIGAGGLSVGTGTTVTYTGASTNMIADAGPVTVTGSSLLNLNGVSDTIGTLGLTATAGNTARVTTGAGTLTLGNNVTFTLGGTGQAQVSGNLALSATRTFTVGLGTGVGYDLLIDAAISGAGGLTKLSTGRMVLSGINSYTGLTTVTDGVLVMTKSSNLGNGGLNIAANKSFIYAPTAAGALDIGSGVLTLGSGTTTSIGTALGGTASQSAITSSGAASLAGTGTVNIYGISGVSPTAGTNNMITASSGLTGGTYTLGTVFNNTDFTISNYTRTATAISVDVASATALSGNVFWKGGLAGNTGVWSASNGSTQSNWQVTDGVNQPLAPGALADLVFSTTTLPGTMVGMSLGSNMTVNSLTINNTATAFGLTDSALSTGSSLTIAPSSSSTGITIGAGVLASSINVPVILGAAQTWTNNSANALTVAGAVTNGANLLTVSGTGNITISGIIGSGAGGLTKSGNGTLTLSGANTYTGNTTLSAGILNLGVAETANVSGPLGKQLANAAGTIIFSGGTLQYSASNTNDYSGRFSTAASQAYNVNTNGQNVTWASNLTSSGGTLTKTGNGTLTLSGTNSYTGALTINAGSVSVGSTANVGTPSSINFTGNSTLSTGASAITITLPAVSIDPGVTATFDKGGAGGGITYTFGGALTGSGTLSFISGGSGNGTFNFNNAGSFTGTVQATSSYLTNGATNFSFASLGDGGKFSYAGTAIDAIINWTGGAQTFNTRQFEMASTRSMIINSNSTNGTGALVINPALSVTGTGTHTLTLGGTNTDANTFGGAISNGSGGALTVAKAGAGTWAISGNMSQTGGITINAGGVLTLSGTNTYSGNTNFSGVGAQLTFAGSQAASPNTTLFMNTNSSSMSSTVKFLDDTGNVNGGTATFGGTYTLQSNNTAANQNTFIVGNNNTANGGTSSGTTTGSTMIIGTMNWNTVANGTPQVGNINIQGTNGYRLQINNVVMFNGSGHTAGNANNTNFIPTTANVTIGAVTMATGNAVNGVIPTLVLDGTSSDNRITGIISNSSDVGTTLRPVNLTKSNTSTWTLSGTNTYTGTTTVTGGRLNITGNSSGATGAVAVSAGTLGSSGSSSLGGAVTVSGAGAIDLRDAAVGTFTLGSTLNITGAAGANNLSFDLGNGTGTSDQISVAGATSVTTSGAAVVNITQLGGLAGRNATTYTLIGGAGTLDATNFAKFTLATTKAFGQSYALTNIGNDLQLVATNVISVTPAAFWKGGANNWSTVTNWNTDAATNIPTGAAPDYQTNVTFNTTNPVAANLTTNVLDVDFDINSLNFSNTAAVTIGGTRLLTIEATNANGNTAGRGITSTQTTVLTTISSRIGLAASQEWSVAGTTAALGGLTVSGIISDFNGGYSLTKAGAGYLTLSGANTFSGGVVLKAGTLAINTSSAALGIGTFQIGDSTGSTAVTVDSLSALAITNAVNIYQDFTYTRSANTLTQSGGAVTLLTNGTTGTKTITVGGALNTIGLTLGQVGDGGNGYGLTKAGTGTLNLSSRFTYTGVTTINAGILALTSGGNQSGGNIVINDGGNLTVLASTSAASGGATVSNNLVLAGASGSRTLHVYGSQNKVDFTGSITSTSSASTILNLTAGNSTAAVGGNGTQNGDRVNLLISGVISDASPTVTTGLSITMQTQSAAFTFVNLSGQNTFTGPITVTSLTASNAYLAIGGEAFASAGNVRDRVIPGSGYLGGGNYTNTIGLNSAAVTLSYLSSQNQILGGAISGAGSLLKEGTGTLRLTAANTYTGSTTISTGILQIGNGGTTGRLTATSAITNNSNLTINRSDAFSQATDLGAGVAITGSGSFTQAGTGTTTLTATNTYTGATTVSTGILIVNGSIATSSLTTVASGATIGGSGMIGALTVSSGGSINPGNSPGILSVTGNYTQAGTYNAEITGTTAGTQYDQINVTGTVDITGGNLATMFSGSYLANDLIFILLNDNTDAITGTYTGLAQGATVTSYGGFNWNISYFADSGLSSYTGGNDIALQAVLIPEPKTALLGVLGALLLLRRRRN